MGRPKRAPAAKEPDYSSAKDAKELLDMIGQTVHSKVHREDANYRGKLYGLLTQAQFSNKERVHINNPCLLDYNYDTNVTSNVIDPCEHKSVERFSEVSGGECDEKKIKGSNGGACAPFRRLHVCDRNLEQIKPHTITATHNLLVDVCYAAQFEGKSISGYYPRYQTKYKDSGSTICTVLARSFADIGDIIRGKDLYEGYDQKDKEQKVKLENKLKDIFKNIYNELTSTNGKKGKKQALQARYQDDGSGNYYQLREDWWDANRAKVWYAITCGAGTSDKYFRKTCSNDTSDTNEKCRCVSTDPPTYFDYVPQYLRWFEEWTEEFCRKKKKKLEDVIKKCRYDENNERKYCSRNGFDCKDTIRAQEKLVKGYDCHKCSVACDDFEPWIKNQKQEFEKQKGKYTKEMQKYANGTTTKETSNGPINNLYADDFYKKLQEHYPSVDEFLEKLNEQQICKDEPKVKEETISRVDFKNVDAFSYKEYCDTCPWCGTEKKQDGTLRYKEDVECRNQPTTPLDNTKSTDIQLSFTDKGNPKILEKFKNLCEENNEKTINWKCHYKEKNVYKDDSDKDYCVLQDGNQNIKDQTIMSFESFFWSWVSRMLNDSIKWRNQHSKCINNKKETKCIEGCKKTCECFEKWVGQKKTEWRKIKHHFDQQENLKGRDRNITLKYYLDILFKEKIKEAYGDERESKELEEKLNNIEGSQQAGDTEHSEFAVDVLLKHEEEIAENCIKYNPEDTCPTSDTGSRARSDHHDPPPVIPRNDFEDEKDKQPEFKDPGRESEDDDDDEDELPPEDEAKEQEEEEKGAGEDEAASEAEASGPKVEVEGKPPCDIVQTLFESTKNLSDACGLKYGPGGKEKFPNWKCISSGSDTGSTTKQNDSEGSEGGHRSKRHTESSDSTTTSSGSVCVPPRRRKLYVGELTKWAEEARKSSTSPQPGESGVANASASSTSSPTDATQLLRDAFIQSAAIETFFLWHKYKAENTRDNKSPLGNGGVAQFFGSYSGSESEEKTPQQWLQSGTIPTDFLRQMFYTLGDYRDLCVGVKEDVINALKASGDNPTNKLTIQQISEKIKNVIEKSGDTPSRTPPGQQPSDNDPKSWWKLHAPYIWNGMIYALTYDTNTASGEKKIEKDDAVYKKLWDEANNKPKKDNGQQDYTYEKVEIKEEDSGQKASTASQTPSPRASGENKPTTLDSFVKRPTYFRYLEEWGETFCRERKKRLEKIKVDCEVEENTGARGGTTKQKYSGDGEECSKIVENKDKIFKDLEKPSCATPCGLYKRWIRRKKDEYNKQKSAYNEQKTKYENGNNKGGGGNGVCGTLQENAADFLKKLGPCSKTYNENGVGKTDFDDDKTFKHTKHCDPCPKFNVNCKNCNSSGGGTKVECNGRNSGTTTITASDIKNGGDSTEINMLVSDKFTTKFEGDGLKACKNANIFKSIRKDVWKCVNICGVDVCGLKKGDNNGELDDKQIILVRALIKRWLEYFLEDYNKIKKKLKSCTEKGEGSPCIKECVDTWITEKRKEWKTIKERYVDKYTKENDGSNDLTTFLQQGPFYSLVEEAKKVVKCKDEQEKLWGCTGNTTGHAQDKCENGDFITNLISKLQEKISECTSQSSGSDCTLSTENPSTTLDDEEPLEEVDQNPEDAQKMIPKICGDVIPKEEAKEEGGCTPDIKKEEEKKEEKKKPEQTAEKPAAETKAKEEKPAQDEAGPPPADPLPAREPFDPTILQTTIPFGVALALGSIAFLFLKVIYIVVYIVINIPKSDYDIPTKLSPNRYIPYTSGKYRGKRYIYLEGDSGTDSGYTDHYSDITSSSESEYEELDINDIYAPHNEWNTLKHDFISQYLQSEQPNDVPNDYSSGDIPLNTQPNTLYFDKPEEKPFITSIHDRNLYTGEEYSYNINMSTNSMDDIPINSHNNIYSGIDLINDSLNSNNVDIYDEVLKRKENELFGTNHVKHTNTHNVTKSSNSDPIDNQLDLFHTWLDRHRDMCEKWNNKEEVLNKLKEEWENETHSGNTHTSDSNKTLNTDVSIQIHMDNPKPINQFTNMDTILEDLEKYNEPYYDYKLKWM
ncbi:hypothetical protein PFNF54_00601 [Plasmodium falciparum NF54]|uniref:Erythrocyte membrane protein 1 n=1 Tax=Plasmodium falciparum (isolate NF54) TaxID=5843 RepID=W7K006_PLAFO|nr:hypothetical protein PFNF54_00601 [Plasmodium falciparum NF54]